MTEEEILKAILELEKSALDKWKTADVDGFIDNSADEITYFDPESGKRIDGKNEFEAYLKPLQGQWNIPDYKIIAPKAQIYGDVAILTFDLDNYSETGQITSKWSSTEVYNLKQEGWKLVHSHWSIRK